MTITAKAGLKKGTILGQWELIKKIGKGGNSQVWRSKNLKGEEVAVKILTKHKEIGFQRFSDEIKIMQTCGVEGVVPIIETHLPTWPTTEYAWYAMPIGVALDKLENIDSVLKKISHYIKIANVLIDLHAKKITHRDIKPGNILVINNDTYLGDFGLVSYPGKAKITGNREEIGAHYTLAPEVRRHRGKNDYRPADVFSLAKSLWISITGNDTGFDGRYDGSKTVSIQPFFNKVFVEPLEELLKDSTEHTPGLRPGIREFRDRLVDWLELNDDFAKANALEWKHAQKRIFPVETPSHAEWVDIDSIVSVLNICGHKTNFNHLFIPTGGGLDLEQSRISTRESGCIELVADGVVLILKPKRLIFEGLGEAAEWDYFLLECDDLEPSGVYEDAFAHGYEEVLDLGVKNYVHRKYSDYGEYDGESLPTGSKVVSRFFSGSFAIFQKTSIYNNISETYEAFQNKMSQSDFRAFVKTLASQLSK